MKQHLLANHFTYQGSVRGARSGWGGLNREPLSGAKQGGSRWFKLVLVNTPLSLHLWCQWVQKDLNLYPPSGRQGEWLECKLVPHSPLWCLQSHVGS